MHFSPLRTLLINSTRKPIETVFFFFIIVITVYYCCYSSLYNGDIFNYTNFIETDPLPDLLKVIPSNYNQPIVTKHVNQSSKANLVLKNIVVSSTRSKLTSTSGILNKNTLTSVFRYLNYLQTLKIQKETNYKKVCLKSNLKKYNLNNCLTITLFYIWDNCLMNLKKDKDLLKSINLALKKDSDLLYLLKDPYFGSDNTLIGAAGITLPFIFEANSINSKQFILDWESQTSNTQFGFLSPHFEPQISIKKYNSFQHIYRTIIDFLYKFKHIINQASVFEIIIVSIGYAMMYLTLIILGINMKMNGSKITMTILSIMEGVFAFLFALFTMKLLGVKVDFVIFTEGIPFVTSAISFQKHYSIFAYIHKTHNNSETSISELVTNAFMKMKSKMLKEYAFEIFVFVIGYLSQIPALSQFCLLSSFILMYDAILIFTLYPAFISIKLHVINYKKLNNGSEENLNTPGNYRNIAYQAFSEDSKHLLSNSIVHHVKLLAIIGALAIQILSFKMNSSVIANKSTIDYDDYYPIIRTLATIGAVDSDSIFKTKAQLIVVDRRLAIFDFIQQLFNNYKQEVSVCILLFLSLSFNVYLIYNVYRRINPSSSQQDVKTYRDHCPSTTAFKSSSDTLHPLPAKVNLQDHEILQRLKSKELQSYNLEKELCDNTRAVGIRRVFVSESQKTHISNHIPYENYDYSKVVGQCCENVIGYVPIPLGVTSPLKIDGKLYTIPMATTEGCLVASTSRGCKAITESNGALTILEKDGMSRGPVLEFSSIVQASKFKKWAEGEGYFILESTFNSTTNFGKLKSIKVTLAGRLVFMRFVAFTGDAMGMNMISKGVERSLKEIMTLFEDVRVVSISGNYCTDKKPSAINWIEGRGKSVVAEAVIKSELVKKLLKTTTDDMVQLNISKNLVGSAMAGSIGGFNAHAANTVTAIFIACGQDPAQNVESSSCITLMEKVNDDDLYISCTMPCIEVGTIGGGTQLKAQSGCLDILGVKGPNKSCPGQNSQTLARIISAAVMAAELSLCAALASGHLVKSHMLHNRAGKKT